MNNVRKKKLTNAGTGVCVLTFIGFIFALIGSLEEFIAVFIYNIKFSEDIDKFFATDFSTYLNVYERPLSLALISLIFFIIFSVSKRKKSVGYSTGILCMVIPVVYSIVPIINLISFIKKDYFMDYLDSGLTKNAFVVYFQLALYLLSLGACFFLLIAGLVVCARLAGEKFAAEVPYLEKNYNNVQPVFAQQDQYVQMPSADMGYTAENVNTSTVNNNQTDFAFASTPAEKCPNCGAELKTNAKFCSVCGQKIGE